MKENKELNEILEGHVMDLGNSINYFCDEVEALTEENLSKIDKKGVNNFENDLNGLEVRCMHTLYLRVIGYSLIRGIMDVYFAEKLSKLIGIELIQDDLKNGISVPNDIVDGMLDEINKNK